MSDLLYTAERLTLSPVHSWPGEMASELTYVVENSIIVYLKSQLASLRDLPGLDDSPVLQRIESTNYKALSAYNKEIHRLIREQAQELKRRGGGTDSEKEQLADAWETLMYFKVAEVARWLRYGAVLALFSVFENHMQMVADQLGRAAQKCDPKMRDVSSFDEYKDEYKKRCKKERRRRPNNIEMAERYLRDEVKYKIDLIGKRNELEALRLIRNAITHDDGVIMENSGTEASLLKDYISEHLDLLQCNKGQIHIDPKYLPHILEEMAAYFTDFEEDNSVRLDELAHNAWSIAIGSCRSITRAKA